jgi:hypothetical protein
VKPRQAILIAAGWIAAGAGVYVALLSLDVYWNLFNWEFRLDWAALGLIALMLAALTCVGLLLRARTGPVVGGVSLCICFGLFALGVYVSPPEPLSAGWFGRVAPSPGWYRGGRLITMALPTLMWTAMFLRRRRKMTGR